jgi:type IV pilus assembly protein PilB
VEYTIAGLNQIQVNPKAGLDFASGLRSILRQDPDKIMIGEIRDAETVEIAIRAAITGHLVLSTIHTNDSVSTIFRLADMNVPYYMIAASLVGVISQRLVRCICPACKQEYIPTRNELDLAGLEDGVFYKGTGCANCAGTGYKGRIAVHEILSIDPTLRDYIHRGESMGKIRGYAIAHGLIPIKDSAARLLKNGVTTIDQVIDISHGT